MIRLCFQCNARADLLRAGNCWQLGRPVELKKVRLRLSLARAFRLNVRCSSRELGWGGWIANVGVRTIRRNIFVISVMQEARHHLAVAAYAATVFFIGCSRSELCSRELGEAAHHPPRGNSDKCDQHDRVHTRNRNGKHDRSDHLTSHVRQ